MDLRRSFDEILEMCAKKEVSEIDKFAVILILDIDYAPPVLAATNLFAIDNNALFRADDSERDQAL